MLKHHAPMVGIIRHNWGNATTRSMKLLASNCDLPAQALCKRKAVYSNIIEVHGEDGQITSPDYPASYSANTVTVYYINAYSAKYTTVTLPVIDIDSESVIYVYEGASTSGHLLAIVKSGHKENTFTGYNGITVKFVSSATASQQTRTGWVLNFSNVRNVHGNGNQVTSPNYPDSYPSNTVTYYHINANYGGLTISTLPVFDIDSESALYIYDGPDDSGQFVIATNASTGLDSSIASFRGITLKFVSSGGDGDKHAGWVLNYYT
uniref:Secreted protein n=1 Tax=Panagrellus redivivus TaxID=6233 RepID=A0A7E4ZYD5_PANRE